MTAAVTRPRGAPADTEDVATDAEIDGQNSAAYTLIEAASLLGISRDTAYRRVAAGDFPVPVWRIGVRWYCSRRALDALLGLD